MSSFEEKKREIERVLGVFQNYIEGSELLDVVLFEKVRVCSAWPACGGFH